MNFMTINGTSSAEAHIGKTGFIPGVGIGLDIRYNGGPFEHKIFVPLNKIRLIIPHSADRLWTRILYGEDEYVVVPILNGYIIFCGNLINPG